MPELELKVPELGESITEVLIGRWHKSPGDPVKKDEEHRRAGERQGHGRSAGPRRRHARQAAQAERRDARKLAK